MNIQAATKIILPVGFLFCLGLADVIGQRPLDIEEIRVVAPYKPAIGEATKIMSNPQFDETPIAKPSFQYTINPLKMATSFEIEPITAVRMRGEPLDRLYRGHFRAGMGTYITPFGELFFNSLRSNEYVMGLHFRHLSSSGKIRDYGHSGFSDNFAQVFGQRFIGTNTLDGSLTYERNILHYYGFRPGDFAGDIVMEPIVQGITPKDIRQRFHRFNAAIGIKSHHADSTKFIYNAGFGYGTITDLFNASEHEIRFDGNLGREINSPLRFVDQLFLNVAAGVDYYLTRRTIDSSSTAIVHFSPGFIARVGDHLKLNAGLAINVQSDTASYARFHPHLSFDIQLLEKSLSVYGSIKGGLQRHSLASLTKENPFINTSAPLGFMNNRLEITGGINGAFSENLSVRFSVTNSAIDNFAFFVTDTATLLNNTFTLAFDNIRRLQVRGELFAQVGPRFQARISACISDYTLNNEIRPWHLPTTEIAFNARYNIQDKIIITADVFSRNTTFGRTFDPLGNPVPKKLHDFHVDGNLGLEYRYTRILSFFMNFSNVGNRPLQRWLNYPTQRFHFMAGATLSF
ncbi:MAG TPA: hypothetical protein VLH61_06090 [Bacteroidales bacterium]|nr:hypothetical protein [Bacteroidales bacterium]